MNPPTFSATLRRTGDNISDFDDLLENSCGKKRGLLAIGGKLYRTGDVFGHSSFPPDLDQPQTAFISASFGKWRLASAVTTIR